MNCGSEGRELATSSRGVPPGPKTSASPVGMNAGASAPPNPPEPRGAGRPARPTDRTMERKIYMVWCPTPSHRRDWTEIPPPLNELPLLATGRPGPHPQLIEALRQCPRCVVRVMMAR